MKILRILQLAFLREYYARACAHAPLHEDVPRIVLRRQEIEDEWSKVWK